MYLTKEQALNLRPIYQWSLTESLTSGSSITYNGGFTRVNVPYNHCLIILCLLLSDGAMLVRCLSIADSQVRHRASLSYSSVVRTNQATFDQSLPQYLVSF